MTDAFGRAVAAVLRHEGGYVLDGLDPGGETNFGISKRAYPDLDIRNLKRADAEAIYYTDYWLPAECDKYPDAVAFVVFDCAVNQGVSTAKRLLQTAVGVPADGVIGVLTLARITPPRSRDIVRDITLLRIQRYQQSPVYARFARGWLRRAITVAMEAHG